jgi:hypothetical protein
MPYQSRRATGAIRYELASRLGHLPTSTNPYIRERLRRYRQPEDTFDPAVIQARVTAADELSQPLSPAVRYVVAVDGSGHEDEEAFDYYPSTRVLYMQIAGVFIDLRLMLDQPGRFVDPARIADATESSVVSGFLPGSFLEHEDYKDPFEAFRAELFDLFDSTVIQQRTLLDILLEVQKHGRHDDQAAAVAGKLWLSKCPNVACDYNSSQRCPGLPVSLRDVGQCPGCGRSLWSTDSLRLYEAFRPDAGNGEVLGRAHQLIEHLVLYGVALSFEQLSPRLLSQTAFLFDGDLAVFGEAARLHRGLLGAWQALAGRCAARAQQPPVLLGVAKTGYPVEHLHGIRRFIPNRHLMRLDDYYMRDRLRVNSLSDTYFGRKFFYHAADGQLLVLTVPPATGDAYAKRTSQARTDRDERQADLSNLQRFPTLARAFDVLDRLGSRLFDDALIPASLAHNWAAYPLANAERVLRVLTEESLSRLPAAGSP